MAFSKEQLKSELIDQVLERVRSRLPAQRVANAEAFLRRYFAHVPASEIVGEEPDNLYGAALTLWGFTQQRQPRETKIRVYNPRPDSHGWKSAHTIVELVNDDMPFLVDSLLAAVRALGGEIYLLIHPVLTVRRDGEGRLTELVEHTPGTDGEAATSVDDARGTVLTESVMHLQISERPPESHGQVQEAVASVLDDVRSAVDDWSAMRDRCRELIAETRQSPPPLPQQEIEEGTAFLEWLVDDHFTFLGYREYLFEGEGRDAVARVVPEVGLGLLRNDELTLYAKTRSLGPMPDHVRSFLKRRELLVISKAGRRSTVHRPVHLDSISLKTLDANGEVVGQRVFVGLFTSVAYGARPSQIPLLRSKAQAVLDRSGLPRNSHDGKALVHILDSYPRDELFQITEEKLCDIAIGILHLQERQRIAFFPRPDAFERYISCLIYVPRDRFDTRLRLMFMDILSAAYEGEISDYYTHLSDSKLARLHVIIKTTPGQIPEVDAEALEQKLVEAGRSWGDRLRDALVDARGEERGVATMNRFSEAFSTSYQDHFNAQTAVSDIAGVEHALESGLALNLYRAIEADDCELRLKIFVVAERVPLSEVLPMLENMGLKVIDEIPYRVVPADLEQPVWIRDFVMQIEDGRRIDDGRRVDLAAIRNNFHEAFRLVWRDEMENDGFNRLVLAAGVTAQDVTILRALCKYLLQARIPFSQAYMEQTLTRNPRLSRLLVALFRRRFDPTLAPAEADENATPDPDSEEGLIARIEARLENVAHLDEDRIIRRYENLIRAILRTNFFQPDDAGNRRPYLSFKIDSRQITNLPRPRPMCEIFVYSPRLEAVHLRGGRVARGGIRWSDRREDFRTEILGLMKAQMVKNAVIVPVGSKGGFVVKRLPSGSREEVMREVVACYQ
ncbi:MAG: NAD-glutamate dehydrogenase domain-containing protein, partial [Acidobacteriota bacterium]